MATITWQRGARRIYVGRYRVHHGLIGALAATIGLVLAYHDRKDWHGD
jgi:hypothetical protein